MRQMARGALQQNASSPGSLRVAQFPASWLNSGRVRAVGVEQLLSSSLQATDDHFGHALHQFITKIMVLVAILAQPGAVEKDGFDRLQRPRIKMPVIGRKEPRPAQHVAGADRLDGDRGLVFAVGFKRDLPENRDSARVYNALVLA